MKKHAVLLLSLLCSLTFLVSSVPMPLGEMVSVKGGSFTMGNTAKEATSSDAVPHQVKIRSFQIGKLEVTQKLFSEVMGFNPSLTQGDEYPVENVTWFDAVAFCNEYSKREGLTPVYQLTNPKKEGVHIVGGEVTCDWSSDGYRLPTEAEWEFAAKAGVAQQKLVFSGSSVIDEVAWFDGNSGLRIHPVGQKKPNSLGLFDMSGNAWEWCWDWYGDYPEARAVDPKGVDDDGSGWRVQRGGSCCDGTEYAGTAYRFATATDYSAATFGFRLARTVKE